MTREPIDTLVVGGGQAGLAAGYHLTQHGRDFVIVDNGHQVGQSWRRRWDSLRLFTPACFTHLPGMAFPAPDDHLPTKDEMAHYLQAYTVRFDLPVRLQAGVDTLERDDAGYLITAGDRQLRARHIIVATGPYSTPYVPAFAGQLGPTITQLHSTGYRNPDQLPAGPVVVVGAGNSGAEIALDLAATHQVWLSGRDPGHVPFTVGCAAYRLLQRVSTHGWLGRMITTRRSTGGAGGDIVVRVQPADLTNAGVQRVPRVAGVHDGQPELADGRVLQVASVVWCTGFVRDYPWINLPIFDNDGQPAHDRGVIATQPGLYFLGLPRQSSIFSDLVGGVGADAERIVNHIGCVR